MYNLFLKKLEFLWVSFHFELPPIILNYALFGCEMDLRECLLSQNIRKVRRNFMKVCEWCDGCNWNFNFFYLIKKKLKKNNVKNIFLNVNKIKKNIFKNK